MYVLVKDSSEQKNFDNLQNFIILMNSWLQEFIQ